MSSGLKTCGHCITAMYFIIEGISVDQSVEKIKMKLLLYAFITIHIRLVFNTEEGILYVIKEGRKLLVYKCISCSNARLSFN